MVVAGLYWKLYHDMKKTCETSLELHAYKYQLEFESRVLAEKKLAEEKAKAEAQRLAIESNALPWVAKNEELEKRFDNEAIDRLANPGFYSDGIPGLGHNA